MGEPKLHSVINGPFVLEWRDGDEIKTGWDASCLGYWPARARALAQTERPEHPAAEPAERRARK
jgi:hypothetical protein